MLLDNIERMEEINDLMWTFNDTSFIPHGSQSDLNPDKHNVYLTCNEENLNNSNIIFSIDDKEVKSILDVSTYINMSTSDEVNLVVLRNNIELTFLIKPSTIYDKDSLGNEIKKKILGIKIAPLYNELNNHIKY